MRRSILRSTGKKVPSRRLTGDQASRFIRGCVVAVLVLLGSPATLARTLTLFSEVEGVILQGGKPIPGVEVERRYVWHWKDQKGEDRAITGQDGRFRFPAITGSSFLGSLIPHEPVVQQSITLRHGGGELLLWKFTKHNYDATGEIPGRPLRMRCDVGDKPAYHLVDEKLKLGYSGICTLE